MSVLSKFRNKKSECITFKELQDFKIGELVDVNQQNKGGILCERLKNKGENLMFRVEMVKNEKWELHFHDCKETLLVYKGVLIDEIKNKKADKVKTLSFKPYTEHIVRALEDSVFYVEFENVLK